MGSDTRHTQSHRDTFSESFQSPTYDDESSITNLPPTDGGKDAWLFLASGFIIEAIVWALSSTQLRSYG